MSTLPKQDGDDKGEISSRQRLRSEKGIFSIDFSTTGIKLRSLSSNWSFKKNSKLYHQLFWICICICICVCICICICIYICVYVFAFLVFLFEIWLEFASTPRSTINQAFRLFSNRNTSRIWIWRELALLMVRCLWDLCLYSVLCILVIFIAVSLIQYLRRKWVMWWWALPSYSSLPPPTSALNPNTSTP